MFYDSIFIPKSKSCARKTVILKLRPAWVSEWLRTSCYGVFASSFRPYTYDVGNNPVTGLINRVPITLTRSELDHITHVSHSLLYNIIVCTARRNHYDDYVRKEITWMCHCIYSTTTYGYRRRRFRVVTNGYESHFVMFTARAQRTRLFDFQAQYVFRTSRRTTG
jgi:hypothetical protein